MSVQISAADVNKLRQQTGAGMMDCKKALTEAGGDFEAAVDYLRKKGAKVSASRSDRDAQEGAVIAKTTADGKEGVIIELNCETDFVAKNADFVAFAEDIASLAIEKKPASLEELLSLELNGISVSDRVLDETGKIGEKIAVSTYETLSAPKVIAYIHGNNRIGVLVGLSADGEGAEEAGKDVAMQIAAMNPASVDKDDVDEATVNRELEIAREQIRAEGKPEEMVDKIAQGKLNKFYKENTLLNQEFVKDSSKTVRQMLEHVQKGLSVTAFKRKMLGS
ncbi:elongation factor Ts [Anseongella ginsenosidimutans]|uniref:Elongation factor Ts n=1 Tax=Anseongella ginsenosidimutans TaxID=496056 RepID=A0A4R3KNF6_9SPHI|nr:translation elongation factor Ts [Anseongella ginsenosidimutans]QEC52006.1 elongation factor Ts [Anseongella ginsenosidimutans]TCS85694.1 elongation factor Ts [Anseongella ginsenosidimutans]